jgi:DNA-binding NarL/FixJ family response regulator
MNEEIGGRWPGRRLVREVRVLLADDYEPWRRCVVALFLKHPEWRVIEEVCDGLDAVKKTQELNPDLVLLDLSLPKLNGVEAANRIRQTTPATKIVFITAYQDSDAIQTVLRNEAEGYVLKWEINRDLLPALETVLSGGKFVSAQLTDPPKA